MKTYQAYQAESRQAETKLRVAEQQRNKLEVANADSRDKLARSKKYKLIEKEVNKVDRKVEYTEMASVSIGRYSFQSSSMVLDPRESSRNLSSSVWLHQLATSLKLDYEVCFVVSARKTCVRVLHRIL